MNPPEAIFIHFEAIYGTPKSANFKYARILKNGVRPAVRVGAISGFFEGIFFFILYLFFVGGLWWGTVAYHNGLIDEPGTVLAAPDLIQFSSYLLGLLGPHMLTVLKARFIIHSRVRIPILSSFHFHALTRELDRCEMKSRRYRVIGPMFTVMYAMDGLDIVLVMGIAQIVVGLLAVVFSVSFFVCKLGNRVPMIVGRCITLVACVMYIFVEFIPTNRRWWMLACNLLFGVGFGAVSCRVLLVFSYLVIIASYLISYPFPFWSSPLKPFNETTNTGCNPAEYPWCDTQLVVNLALFLITVVICNSLAIPSTNLSLDTIYSKIIGDIDQNVMQAIFVVAEDLMSIVGPIYGTAVFTAIGMNFLQIINGCIYILGTVLWIAAWKWLAPYK